MLRAATIDLINSFSFWVNFDVFVTYIRKIYLNDSASQKRSCVMASNRTNLKNKSIFYIIPSTIYNLYESVFHRVL